jgi:glutaredoxin
MGAGKSGCDYCKKVIRLLEDRRTLFELCAEEEPQHCYLSAVEIRKTLTELLADVSEGSDLFKHLVGMRSACRTFLDRSPSSLSRSDLRDRYSLQSGQFFIAVPAEKSVFRA